MNLFRSEEHARAWAAFDPAFAHTLRPLAVWAERFSGAMFRERGRPDYVSWLAAWRASPEARAWRESLMR
jgi:hypothetical protein